MNTIVITEEKKNRKGLWIAAAGAALLLGGSTFALWSAQDTISGGTITAGDLNIATTADTSFWDVSNDRTDATATVGATDGSQPGHGINDVNTWKIAPGDKLAASFEAAATLEGDNLVARLGIDGLEKIAGTNTGINYSYEVYSGGALVVSETALPSTADAPLLYLSAPGAGQDAGLEDATVLLGAGPAVDGAAAQSTVFEMPDATTGLNVVLYASFYTDANGDFRYQASDITPVGLENVNAASTLADLSLSLNQVRDTGAVFTTAQP